jgi:hypothetical protein
MTLRTLLVICAAVAAIVLALVVLIGNPSDPQDLLAGAGIASGAGLLGLAVP